MKIKDIAAQNGFDAFDFEGFLRFHSPIPVTGNLSPSIRDSDVGESIRLFKEELERKEREKTLSPEERQKIKEEADRKYKEIKEAEEKAKQEELAKAQAERAENEKHFMATTGYSFEGYRIIEYRGIANGEVVLGTGFFSESGAAFADLFGTASISMGEKFARAKKAALAQLQNDCLLRRANAVIGVDIDITTIGNNMVVASANGTAVRIEKKQEND